jgi:hypothetical protein
LLDHRARQIGLGGKVVMDACLAYLHFFSNVCVAESVVATHLDKAAGRVDELLLRRHGTILSLGRQMTDLSAYIEFVLTMGNRGVPAGE